MAWLALKWFGVPRWLVLLGALALVVGGSLVWHSRAVENLRSESYKKGWGDQKARSDAIIAKLDAENLRLAGELRKKTDAQAVAIRVAAERERVLGPGRAAVRCPAAAASAGRSDGGSRPSDDARADLPAGDWAAVPWGWLVSHAQTCDLNLNRAKAWDAWYEQVAKGFARARAE